MKNLIPNHLICAFNGHKWTSKANEGIKASKDEIEDGITGFYRYARMYCKRCGKYSKLNTSKETT